MHFLLFFLAVFCCRPSHAVTLTKITYLPNGQVGGYELIINNTVQPTKNAPLPRDSSSKIVKQTSTVGSFVTKVDEQVIGKNSYLSVRSFLNQRKPVKYPVKNVLVVPSVRYVNDVPVNVRLRFAQIGPYAALIVPANRLGGLAISEYPVPPEIRDFVKAYIEVQQPPAQAPSSGKTLTGYAYAPPTYETPPSSHSPSTPSAHPHQPEGNYIYPSAITEKDSESGHLGVGSSVNNGFVIRVPNPTQNPKSYSGNDFQEFFVPSSSNQLDLGGEGNTAIANPFKYSGSTGPSSSQYEQVYNKVDPSASIGLSTASDSFRERANGEYETSPGSRLLPATAAAAVTGGAATDTYEHGGSSTVGSYADTLEDVQRVNTLGGAQDPGSRYHPLEGPPHDQPEFSDVSPGSDSKSGIQSTSETARLPVFNKVDPSIGLSTASDYFGKKANGEYETSPGSAVLPAAAAAAAAVAASDTDEQRGSPTVGSYADTLEDVQRVDTFGEAQDHERTYHLFEGPPPDQPEYSDVSPGSDSKLGLQSTSETARLPVFNRVDPSIGLSTASDSFRERVNGDYEISPGSAVRPASAAPTDTDEPARSPSVGSYADTLKGVQRVDTFGEAQDHERTYHLFEGPPPDQPEHSDVSPGSDSKLGLQSTSETARLPVFNKVDPSIGLTTASVSFRERANGENETPPGSAVPSAAAAVAAGDTDEQRGSPAAGSHADTLEGVQRVNTFGEAQDPERTYHPLEGPPPDQPEFSDVSPGSDSKSGLQFTSETARLPVFGDRSGGLVSLGLNHANQPVNVSSGPGQDEGPAAAAKTAVSTNKKLQGSQFGAKIEPTFKTPTEPYRSASYEYEQEVLNGKLKSGDFTAKTQEALNEKYASYSNDNQPSEAPSDSAQPSTQIREDSAGALHNFGQFSTEAASSDSGQRFQAFQTQNAATSNGYSSQTVDVSSDSRPDIFQGEPNFNLGKLGSASTDPPHFEESLNQKESQFNGFGNRQPVLVSKGEAQNHPRFDIEKFKAFTQDPSLTTKLKFVSPNGQTSAVLTSTGNSAKVELPYAAETDEFKGNIFIPKTVIHFPIKDSQIKYEDRGYLLSSELSQSANDNQHQRFQEMVQSGKIGEELVDQRQTAYGKENNFAASPGFVSTAAGAKTATNDHQFIYDNGKFGENGNLRTDTESDNIARQRDNVFSSAKFHTGASVSGDGAVSNDDRGKFQSFSAAESAVGLDGSSSVPSEEAFRSDAMSGIQTSSSQFQQSAGGIVANGDLNAKLLQGTSSSGKGFLSASGSKQDVASGNVGLDVSKGLRDNRPHHSATFIPQRPIPLESKAGIPIALQAGTSANQRNLFDGVARGFDQGSAAADGSNFQQFNQDISAGTKQASAPEKSNTPGQQGYQISTPKNNMVPETTKAPVQPVDPKSSVVLLDSSYASAYGRSITLPLEQSHRPGLRIVAGQPSPVVGPHTQHLLKTLNGLFTESKRQ